MTPSLPDVSIIVVSKDDAADLPVSLASALAQTGVACETLLVDNASTDGSREVGGSSRRAAPRASRERGVRGRDERGDRGDFGALRPGPESGLPPRARLRVDTRSAAGRRRCRRRRLGVGKAPPGAGPPARSVGPARLRRDLLHGGGPPFRPRGGGARERPVRPGGRGLRSVGGRRLLPARRARDGANLDRLVRRGLLPVPRGRRPGVEASKPRVACRSTCPRPRPRTGGATSRNGAGA